MIKKISLALSLLLISGCATKQSNLLSAKSHTRHVCVNVVKITENTFTHKIVKVVEQACIHPDPDDRDPVKKQKRDAAVEKIMHECDPNDKTNPVVEQAFGECGELKLKAYDDSVRADNSK